jgi:tricorn protease
MEISTKGQSKSFDLPRAANGKFSPDGLQFVYEQISPWEHEFRNYRGGQNNPLRIFDLKPLRHRNYLGKTAEISILFGWTRSTFFLIAILV